MSQNTTSSSGSHIYSFQWVMHLFDDSLVDVRPRLAVDTTVVLVLALDTIRRAILWLIGSAAQELSSRACVWGAHRHVRVGGILARPARLTGFVRRDRSSGEPLTGGAVGRAEGCAIIGVVRAAELGTSTRGTCGRVRSGWTRVAFAAGARGFGLGLARRLVIGVAVVPG